MDDRRKFSHDEKNTTKKEKVWNRKKENDEEIRNKCM